MPHAINAPLSVDGQTIATQAGPVVVAVQRSNAAAFRLSVRHGRTGAEVPGLSRVFPTERAARHAARVTAALFRSGWSVEQVLDLVALFTADPAGPARIANRRRSPKPRSSRPEGGPDMQQPIPDEVKATADEWYAYPGSLDEGKPPYWVARHATTVSSQIDGHSVESLDCLSVERARAEFADTTCDPDGPGAPRPGDTIRVFWGDAAGERFTVESATADPRDGGWTEFTVTGSRSGRPVALTLGQYAIESRPADSTADADNDEYADSA